MALLDDLGNVGSFTQGLVAFVAGLAGLKAWSDWGKKRARDRRAEVATRVIRLVAVTCEDMGAAVLAPALRAGWAEVAGRDGRRAFLPVTQDMLRAEFERLMRIALDEVRELYKVNVEARVHLVEKGEVESLGRFISACHEAEERARSATLATDDVLSAEQLRELQTRLTTVNEEVIAAREHVVRVLGPVARDGLPAST